MIWRCHSGSKCFEISLNKTLLDRHHFYHLIKINFIFCITLNKIKSIKSFNFIPNSFNFRLQNLQLFLQLQPFPSHKNSRILLRIHPQNLFLDSFIVHLKLTQLFLIAFHGILSTQVFSFIQHHAIRRCQYTWLRVIFSVKILWGIWLLHLWGHFCIIIFIVLLLKCFLIIFILSVIFSNWLLNWKVATFQIFSPSIIMIIIPVILSWLLLLWTLTSRTFFLNNLILR